MAALTTIAIGAAVVGTGVAVVGAQKQAKAAKQAAQASQQATQVQIQQQQFQMTKQHLLNFVMGIWYLVKKVINLRVLVIYPDILTFRHLS